MRKILFLSVIHVVSLLYAEEFTTSNGKYSCDLGCEGKFTNIIDKKNYYMKLFFCKSTGDNSDGFYKFISYNLYNSSNQSSLISSKSIGIPLNKYKDNSGIISVANIQSMAIANEKTIGNEIMPVSTFSLDKEEPCFHFPIILTDGEKREFGRLLTIYHLKGGFISIDDPNSVWISCGLDDKDTQLASIVYDSSQ